MALRAYALLLLLVTATAWAEEGAPAFPAQPLLPVAEGGQVELMWEADPYYSNVALNIPLADKPIPTIRSTSELTILRELMQDSLIPRYLLLEASVYPMPLLGTWLKAEHTGLYYRGQLAQSQINVIESATAGFQEPWAVSMFFGNIAKLVRPGDARKGSNLGYTGYLLSMGVKHIKSNVLIDDRWLEAEWKIKGKLDYPDEKLSWSFRIGGKFHEHPEIADVVYLSLYRSNLNASSPLLAWLNNSTFNLKLHFTQQSMELVRQELIVGRKYPDYRVGRFVPTLDIGFIWASPHEYSGSLREIEQNSLTLVLRPSLEF